VSDEVIDFRDQIFDRAGRAAPGRLVGDDREESLDSIESTLKNPQIGTESRFSGDKR
jgi:hypothetical protein